ncbi:hypothetical protein E4U21_005106 [Claviceps maximensis]|nr:hypothetical protein E4U21_005106 [Claviceps maximensis]
MTISHHRSIQAPSSKPPTPVPRKPQVPRPRQGRPSNNKINQFPKTPTRRSATNLPAMVHRIAFWSCFGAAVRFWQVGIEMRPFFNKSSLWAYPAYALGGASFGYWLQGIDDKQSAMLEQRKALLLEKRKRMAEREGEAASA